MFNLLSICIASSYLLLSQVTGLEKGTGYGVQVEQQKEKIFFIGEVKGHSYIKLELDPVNTSSEFIASGDEQLKYQGLYYESVRGRRYRVTGVFDVEERDWTFRCFNSSNRQVFIFKGKQMQSGVIEGTWWSKSKKYPFYLRSQ